MSQSLTGRVTPRPIQLPKKRIWLDFIVVVLCLSAACGGFYMFYTSIFQSLNSNAEQVGVVILKINSVQRRMADRAIWDRVYNNSPVYDGDLIRVPELSGAVLHFDGNELELSDNTLIRILLRNGRPVIELSSGGINLDTTSGSGSISLVIDGRTIDAAPGAVLSAAATDDGMALQVNEGNVLVIEETGEVREEEAGSVISTGDWDFQEVLEEVVSNAGHVVEIVEVELAPPVELEAEPIIALSLPAPEPIMIIPPQFDPIILESVAALPEPVAPPPPEPAPAAPAPVPMFASPGNRQPANGYRLGTAQLAQQTGVVFSWSPVQGANAYIVTLLHQTSAGRRQIAQSNPQTQTTWTFRELNLLERGTIVWQVEAVNRNRNGVIEQRGNIGENTFIVDVPVPGPVRLLDTGSLYGAQ